MAATGVKKPIAIEDIDNDIRTVTRRYRGHVYVITELPMVEYQKTITKATSTQKDSVTGEDVERFDADYHTAIMLGKCVTVDGKRTTAEALYEKGTALVRQLQRDVSALHFDEEKLEEDPEDEGDGDAGEAVPES